VRNGWQGPGLGRTTGCIRFGFSELFQLSEVASISVPCPGIERATSLSSARSREAAALGAPEGRTAAVRALVHPVLDSHGDGRRQVRCDPPTLRDHGPGANARGPSLPSTALNGADTECLVGVIAQERMVRRPDAFRRWTSPGPAFEHDIMAPCARNPLVVRSLPRHVNVGE
jgi:hypothetical protein